MRSAHSVRGQDGLSAKEKETKADGERSKFWNPEQWMDYPEILEQDLAYFKKARINEVSLGMFSWAFLEPEEGVFRLEWLKEVIDRLYENEIVVMLSTPTAARPR